MNQEMKNKDKNQLENISYQQNQLKLPIEYQL